MQKYLVSEHITKKIYWVRGHKVMFDIDLARLYDVKTKELNKAVKRNLKRFPSDFMFRLSVPEYHDLRFQFGTSSVSHGGRRYIPYAFTEQGVAMLSSVLRSDRAAVVNVAIMRAFVKFRDMLVSNEELARNLQQLEKKLQRHDAHFRKHRRHIQIIFSAIRELLASPKNIGFRGPPLKETSSL